MKKYLIIILFAISTLCSYSQGYTYRKSTNQTEWIWIWSLPKPASTPHHKLQVKVVGGYYSNYSMGETVYTMASRDGLRVNMSRERGITSTGVYNFKIYEADNSIDFVLEIPYQWVILNIESILIDAKDNQIEATKQVQITRYDPTGKKDITDAYPTKVFSATAQNGDIGIGTASPTAKLDVNGNIKGTQLDINGTIRSKEVKIEATGWSDFVFGEDYKLPALSEVESHIKEHKHLPDIPSEKQVLEEGVNVIEMQAKLLQKIEELTLYVIDLKKENKELEKKYNELKEEFNDIKK